MGELETPEEFVAWLRYLAALRRRNHHVRPHASALTRVADLLERQALRPIPVSERLPGPDELCWWFEEDEEEERYGCSWTLLRIVGNTGPYTHWLPAHALPLPEVE